MPKETFFNLPDEKREKIISVLRKHYKSKPFSEVSVKEIVEALGIARGSFYQYFRNLEESYFMILEYETIDMHTLFIKCLRNSNFKLFPALDDYGYLIAEAIFHGNAYEIYKNRYLYWNEKLERGWALYQKEKDAMDENRADAIKNSSHFIEKEVIHFIKTIIHDLIRRIFTESWSKTEFLEFYKQHINYIKKGVPHDHY